MKYNSLDKRAITVMRINSIILFVFVIVLFIIYKSINLDFMKEIMAVLSMLWLIIIIFTILNIIVFPKIKYERYKYAITKEQIDVKKGLFVITRTIIPIERVQKIELTNGPIDRRFDLSSVVIYTAAGNTMIKFLNSKEAKYLSDKVNALLKEKLNENK